MWYRGLHTLLKVGGITTSHNIWLHIHVINKVWKNTFVISKNMVPERGSVPLVIHAHPCHPLLHLTRFLCILEGEELPLQVSLLSILLIGIIKNPGQTILHSQRLWIDVSQFFSNAPLKPPTLSTLPITSLLLFDGVISNVLSYSSLF